MSTLRWQALIGEEMKIRYKSIHKNLFGRNLDCLLGFVKKQAETCADYTSRYMSEHGVVKLLTDILICVRISSAIHEYECLPKLNCWLPRRSDTHGDLDTEIEAKGVIY